jgi:quercetin dioxygenase-like cupin family protein
MADAIGAVIGAGEGEALWFGGGRMALKVTSADAFVAEDRMPRGKTTPLHLHASFDETIIVLEGEVLVHIDGAEHTAGAGGVAAIPRGVVHAFLVTSEEALVMSVCTPGDVAEAFFRAGGDPAIGDEVPPLDIAKVKAAGESTGGMVVLGPPPFAKATV